VNVRNTYSGMNLTNNHNNQKKYAYFKLLKNPIRKDLGIASQVSPVNLIVLVSFFRIPQFSPLYLIEPKFVRN